MNKEELIARIAEVFPSNPAPTRDEIVVTNTDQSSSDVLEFKDFFGSRDWKSISPKDVFWFKSALFYFQPMTLVYFSAAFMTASLIDREEADAAIDFLQDVLAEADSALWSDSQRECVCMWLKYFNHPTPRFPENCAMRNFQCSEAGGG